MERKVGIHVKRLNRAARLFQKFLAEKGFNLPLEQARKLYLEFEKEQPRFRARMYPVQKKLGRVEIIGQDEYGEKFVIEAGHGEIIPRKRKGKSRWKVIASMRGKRGGRFNLSVPKKGKPILSLSYFGGGHSDYYVLDPLTLSNLYTYLKELGMGAKGAERMLVVGSKTKTKTKTKNLNT